MNESPIHFSILKKSHDCNARVGILKTPHGDIETPAYIAVGTKATVKGVTPEQLLDLGAQVMLANTYHLYLQPGDHTIKEAGGLHSFSGWTGPMMTDSGGFQVFSLGVAYGKGINKILETYDPSTILPERSVDTQQIKLATVGEDGVTFKSVIDGSIHYFTAERSIEIQHNLGADIIFSFDECTAPNDSYDYQSQSVDRTHRWAKRSLDYHRSKENSQYQALFGVIQGGRYEDLRKKSAQFHADLPFDGFGIGGSFTKDDLKTAVHWVNQILPENKPRHLLGIGEPRDIFLGVEEGCDTFDCVAATRIARNATAYTSTGTINLMNSTFKNDHTKIEQTCLCYTCVHFSRAYIAHLFRAKEMLAGTLTSIHNLYFIHKLVAQMRQAILDDTFLEFKSQFMNQYYGEAKY
jgi:queuine tRNA-ribosyltransferase